MKVVDTNVLLYAANRADRHHQAAMRWLSSALNSDEAVAFPWISLLGFVRIATNPRAFDPTLSVRQAFDLVDAWLACPPALVIEASPRHLGLVRGLLETAGTAGNLVTDAHIAALALEHHAEVATFDRDFERFEVPYVVPS